MSKAAELAALIGSQTAQGNKNLIINGAMDVAQRGTVTGATNDTYGGPDRFSINEGGALVVTLSQDTDVPTGSGFLNSMKVDVTTEDSSLAATDYAYLGQKLEGQLLQRLKKGTSSAESVTLSFWVKSTITGTYIIQLYDNDNGRHISKSYTVSSSNTWEFKTLTFAGDTTGALDNNNEYSLQVYWWLAGGSNYTDGTLATSWAAFNDGNAATGQENAVNSTDNNFYLTGVQLEMGDVATAFEYENISTTLQKCRRYFNRMGADHAYSMWGAVFCASGTIGKTTVLFPVEMSKVPELGSSAANTLSVYAAAGTAALTNITINTPSTWGTNLTLTVSSGLTTGQAGQLMANNNADAYLEFIAEL